MNQDQVIFAASVVVLAVLSAVWLRDKAKRQRARNWPTAPGQVESTDLVLTSGGGQPGAAAFYAEVKYVYEVAGETYRGILRRRFILKGRADKWISEIAARNQVTVHYDPETPRDSFVLNVE